MREFACPACGAPGTFQSGISVYAVCAYCRSMVLRRDAGVEAFGKMAVLPPDMSPLQIGSRGVFEGLSFALVGRHKIGWSDGTWNEWFMATDDGRKGWLAEAQGFFAVCFELPWVSDGRTAVNRDLGHWKPVPGEQVNVGLRLFTVVDLKEAMVLGGEGELPAVTPCGKKYRVIDLETSDGGFASIEPAGQQARRVYLGRYTEWGELHIENPRSLEGW